MNPYLLSATQAIELIKAKKLSPTDLARSISKRIKKLEPWVHAWASFDEDYLVNQAKDIESKIKSGTFQGTLYGVPVGIKDIYNTKHFNTEMGSPIWKGFSPGNDSRVVDYIKLAGGTIPGKTVTAEFAVHHPGPTVNPHNPLHTPGTSSSGSAAAVAASMVPLAIGSQTAGSTIRPASYCGIYGFKPSFGVLPRTGVLKTVDVLDHVTIFSRTIEDIELLFDVMRVRGTNFPFVNEYLDNREKHNTPWKVAFIKTHLWDKWEGYAKEAILGFINKISKDRDLIVSEVEIPKPLTSAHDIHRIIYNKALSYYYKDEYKEHKDMLSEVFRELVEDGMKITNEEYILAQKEQMDLAEALDNFFEDYDAIITLSTAGEAKKGLDSRDIIDSCLIWTLCKAPSVNLPVFSGPNKLPFGAQAIFRRYRDYQMLNFLTDLKKKGFVKDVSYPFQ